MKTVISMMSVLECAFSLDAQIITTLNRLPNGMEEITIRNNSASSLVAFVVYAKRLTQGPLGTSPHVMYSDPLIESTLGPLPPGEQRVVIGMVGERAVTARGTLGRVPSGSLFSGKTIVAVFEEPILAAGIFADGATTGDSALLTRLILRRCSMLQAVETALEMLADAGRHNVPRNQVIGQFRRMADSVRRWYLPLEQQVGLAVYQPMIGKLMSLPEVPVGSPFPPTAFVEEETAKLNQQRVKLLESQPSLADASVVRR